MMMMMMMMMMTKFGPPFTHPSELVITMNYYNTYIYNVTR